MKTRSKQRNALRSLAETRMQRLQEEQDMMIRTWAPYINAANKYMQKNFERELMIHEARAIAQCCMNALDAAVSPRGNVMLRENTTEDNIDFLGVQLPIITAILPSSVLNQIATMQAMERRVAALFYLNVLYGTDKGGVSSGDTMISSRTGHDRTTTGRRYAWQGVDGETVTGSAGASSGDVLAHTCSFKPGIRSGYTEIKNAAGTVVGSDATTAGTLSGTYGAGTINYTTGVVAFTLTSDVDSDGLTISYQYQYDLVTDSSGNLAGVPEGYLDLVQEAVTAEDFPIRTKWSLGAALDAMKAHNLNLEDEVTKFFGGEIQFTIDQRGLDLMDEAAVNGVTVSGTSYTPATAATNWNAQVGSGQEWVWKKLEIMDRFEEMSNNIFSKTLRGSCTVLVVGNNIARVIRQLPDFQPQGDTAMPIGPMVIGKLNGRTVVQNPLMQTRTISSTSYTGANRYFGLFKGPDLLHSSFIFAPYIPLISTPTLQTNDLFAQKGFLSAAAFKVVNAGLFSAGTISNLGA